MQKLLSSFQQYSFLIHFNVIGMVYKTIIRCVISTIYVWYPPYIYTILVWGNIRIKNKWKTNKVHLPLTMTIFQIYWALRDCNIKHYKILFFLSYKGVVYIFVLKITRHSRIRHSTSRHEQTFVHFVMF